MFLTGIFAWRLLAREVTIFPGKIKSSKILLQFIKPTSNCKKSLPGVQNLDQVDTFARI